MKWNVQMKRWHELPRIRTWTVMCPRLKWITPYVAKELVSAPYTTRPPHQGQYINNLFSNAQPDAQPFIIHLYLIENIHLFLADFILSENMFKPYGSIKIDYFKTHIFWLVQSNPTLHFVIDEAIHLFPFL